MIMKIFRNFIFIISLFGMYRLYQGDFEFFVFDIIVGFISLTLFAVIRFIQAVKTAE